jgi:hypothetical protein
MNPTQASRLFIMYCIPRHLPWTHDSKLSLRAENRPEIRVRVVGSTSLTVQTPSRRSTASSWMQTVMLSQSGIRTFRITVCGREHDAPKGLAARARHTPLAGPLLICNNRKIHARETRSAYLIGFARYNVGFILVFASLNTMSDNAIDVSSFYSPTKPQR